MYVLIIPNNLVCLLFSNAIPTSLFNFKQLFLLYIKLMLHEWLVYSIYEHIDHDKIKTTKPQPENTGQTRDNVCKVAS